MSRRLSAGPLFALLSLSAAVGCSDVQLDDDKQPVSNDLDTADEVEEDSGGDDGGDGDGDGDGGDDGGSDDGDDGGGGGDDGGDDGGAGGDDGSGDDGDDEPCPDGLICVSSFPYTEDNTTTGAASDLFDSYGCSPSTDESGPEVIYQVDLAEDGFLAVDLPEGDMASGADIDVHILGSLDSDDCFDRGHWRSGAWLPAGRYFVVADSWVSSSGSESDGAYSITLGHTSRDTLPGASRRFSEAALQAFDIAWGAGDTDSFVYSMTDWSIHSSVERNWVVDLATNDLLFHLHTTHGEASAASYDYGLAVSFSNISESHQTSLGMMRAGDIYTGSYGYSMRLHGLEDGYNDNVYSRAIVLHPWEWARAEVVDEYGMVGLSWGCPAVDDRISTDLINAAEDDTLFFYWYPDGDWSNNSVYLP
jgi:hypothetical protein